MTGLLAAIGPLIAVLLAAAATVGVWTAVRVGRNTQTLSNYKQAADSWRERAEATEARLEVLQQQKDEQMTALRAENSRQAQRVSDLEGQVRTLQGVVSGVALLEALQAELRGVADGIMAEIAAGRADIGRLQAGLASLAEEHRHGQP